MDLPKTTGYTKSDKEFKNTYHHDIPYLREYKAHLFQPNIAFKIGVRIRLKGALDSSTNLNNFIVSCATICWEHSRFPLAYYCVVVAFKLW